MPVITAVRTAAHPECGYDRLVIDFTGPLPGYAVRYVRQLAADPSGEPIVLPGGKFLQITVRPAQAHSDAGAAHLTRQMHVTGYPMLSGWVLAGDFEGVVTLGIGLQSTASIRIGELPGRLYLDVSQ